MKAFFRISQLPRFIPFDDTRSSTTVKRRRSTPCGARLKQHASFLTFCSNVTDSFCGAKTNSSERMTLFVMFKVVAEVLRVLDYPLRTLRRKTCVNTFQAQTQKSKKRDHLVFDILKFSNLSGVRLFTELMHVECLADNDRYVN